ncbi:MAG: helix-turn-helix domain-containing protein [Alphaproteobacteria bacterium]|nr:helix-turn-helix domain-containing protein [Alphaproteobacteria bacterium]
MTEQNAFLTREQAAHYLGVSVPTMARWASRSLGPSFYKFGRRTKYRLHDLEAFVETRRKPA